MRKIQITAVFEYRNIEASEASEYSKELVEEILLLDLSDTVRVTHVLVTDQEEKKR